MQNGFDGFHSSGTFQIQNQEEETAADEHLTDQTTPGIGHRPIQGPALDYQYGEAFQPQVSALVSQAAELRSSCVLGHSFYESDLILFQYTI